MLRVEMGATAPLPPADQAALEAYVLSLAPFDRGRIGPDGTPTEPVSLRARRGFAVFQRAGCAGCHPPPAYTRPGPVDIGTGGAFDVPTLRGAAELRVLGHDGRWPTLESALDAHPAADAVSLSTEERAQLLEYLKLL
jgi:cytochrome c peroxidase